MRPIMSASLIVLAIVLTQPAIAQLDDQPVPMDKAPFHVPIFSNDYVILLRINIPPGRHTGFHTHYADSVSVNLSPVLRTDQLYGSSEVTGPATSQPAPGLRVYVRGGVLEEVAPGSSDRGMAPYAGDFMWQDGGQTRAVKNTGTTVLEFVEFEFKWRALLRPLYDSK